MSTISLHDLIAESQPNICQIAAWRDGKLWYSDTWRGYAETDCQHVMSVTKSIVSLLVGIAIDQGKIASIDAPVLSFFPDYSVKRGEKTIHAVTIRHLLTMRAPFKRHDPWKAVCTSDDWARASLDFLGGRKGLTETFDYTTVCLQILTGILARATGMKTVDFANEFLFAPLGIARHENFYAKDAEEHKKFILGKSPKPNIWFADPNGIATPGYGLCMSAVDMARIGQLCLNDGMWNGRRIVSASWLHEMTRPRTIEEGPLKGKKYGYLWWSIHPRKNIYAALGNSGNVIYVDPARNLTVAITASFKPTVFDRVEFIENTLLPALGYEAD